MVDITLLGIGIFIIVIIGFTILFAPPIWNQVFKTGEQVNQTSITVNQTALFLESTKHEDEAREKQNQLEMKGRSNQTRAILNNTQDLLERHHNGLIEINKELKQHFDRQNNTTQKIITDILNISNQHDQVAKDHNRIQNDVRNVTDNIDKSLYRYGENSIQKFEQLETTQKIMNNTLQKIWEKLN